MLPHTCCPAASPMHMHVTCTSIHPCTRHLHLRVYPWCLKCRRTFVHAGRALAQATLLGPAPPACTFVYPCRVLCGVKCGSTIGVKFLSSVCVRLGVLPTDTVSSVCVRLGVPPTRQRSGCLKEWFPWLAGCHTATACGLSVATAWRPFDKRDEVESRASTSTGRRTLHS